MPARACAIALLATLACSPPASAQMPDAPPAHDARPPVEQPPADTPPDGPPQARSPALVVSNKDVPDDGLPQDGTPQHAARTLDTVHVTAERPPTRQEEFRAHLRRNWHPPRSAEQFGLDGGVPAWLAQQMIRGATAAARSLPGWKLPEQPAIARPPPLDEEQMDRSQALQEAEE